VIYERVRIDDQLRAEAHTFLSDQSIPDERTQRLVRAFGGIAGLGARREKRCGREHAQSTGPSGLGVEQAQRAVHGPRSACG
jgi:hypothetical protein